MSIVSFSMMVALAVLQDSLGAIADLDKRIVGGHHVKTGDKRPFYVLVYRKDTDRICGGVLVTRQVVVTTAYCIQKGKTRVFVCAGDFTVKNSPKNCKEGWGRRYSDVRNENRAGLHDIAVIELNEAFPREQTTIIPIGGDGHDWACPDMTHHSSLYLSGTQPPDGTIQTKTEAEKSELLEIKMTPAPNVNHCKEGKLPQVPPPEDWAICLLGENLKGCLGKKEKGQDIGGPIYPLDTTGHRAECLYGIISDASWMKDECNNENWVLGTQIHDYRDWIQKIINEGLPRE